MDTPAEPRKRNAPRTRAAILAAAQKAFSTLGYPQAGIREIAALAGVSSALLIRYYGSKAGLYEEALTDAMRMVGLQDQSRERFGARLATLFFDPSLEFSAPAMVALATGDAEAREIATRVTEEMVIGPLTQWIGGPDARSRATRIVMLSTGFVMYSRQVPLVPVGQQADPVMRKWLESNLQALVDV